MNRALIVVGCVLAVGTANVLGQAILDAGQILRGTTSSPVYMQAGPGQVLQFRGDLVLDGKTLIIDAPTIDVIGQVTIRAFGENQRAADAPPNTPDDDAKMRGKDGPPGSSGGCRGDGQDGCQGSEGVQGETGKPGSQGRPAGRVELYFESITGGGTLTILSNGEGGGSGGPGGQGGNGGRGGNGSGRACRDFWGAGAKSPGDGGQGGKGGRGGQGGPGGNGGEAARVLLSRGAQVLFDAGQLKAEFKGGAGGIGGEGGRAGNPGAGGSMGGGASCGGGGTDGPPGPAGEKGPQGTGGKTPPPGADLLERLRR